MKRASKGEGEKRTDEKSQQAVTRERGGREERGDVQEELPAAAHLQVQPKEGSEGDVDTTSTEREAGSESHHERKEGRKKDKHTHAAGNRKHCTQRESRTYLSIRRLGLSTRKRLLQGVGGVRPRSHVAPTPAVSPRRAAHNQWLQREILGEVRARRGRKGRRWRPCTLLRR